MDAYELEKLQCYARQAIAGGGADRLTYLEIAQKWMVAADRRGDTHLVSALIDIAYELEASLRR